MTDEVSVDEQTVKSLREWWLFQAATFLLELIASSGLPTVAVRVSCGWPSQGALGRDSYVMGQCFRQEVCADGVAQIFISPRLADSIEVLGTLLHELLHACVGCQYGHGKQFSQPARLLGLVGPPTATRVGPQLAVVLQSCVERMGSYPHAPIVVASKSKVGSRLRLYECHCRPPVKLRVARDELRVWCLDCASAFVRAGEEL